MSMTHGERLHLADEISRKVLDKYGDGIVAVAVYGSVAKSDDDEYSDLEMWVATTEDVPPRAIPSVYKGIMIDLDLIRASRILQLAGEVTKDWPIVADTWNSYLPLFERGDFFQQLKQTASDVPDEAFSGAIREQMVHCTEVMGKLKNSWKKSDLYGILNAGRGLARSCAMVISLANRRYFPSTRDLYQLSTTMHHQPKDYSRLLDTVGNFSTANARDVYRASLELWDNLQSFVRATDIEWLTTDWEI